MIKCYKEPHCKVLKFFLNCRKKRKQQQQKVVYKQRRSDQRLSEITYLIFATSLKYCSRSIVYFLQNIYIAVQNQLSAIS